MKYCFLDLETTGLEHDRDSILEISFVITDEKINELARFDEVVLPHKTPLTPFVTHLTGITSEEVEKNGKKWNDLVNDVTAKIGDSIIVGHNIDFDIRFLRENGIALEKNDRIDTHELARILLPGDESFSLEAITQRLGLSHKDAHRAMSDVIACIQLWPILIEKIKALPEEAIPNFSTFFTQQDWAAGKLFLQYCGTGNPASFKKKITSSIPVAKFPEVNNEEIKEIEKNNTTFVRIGATGESARWLTAVAEKLKPKTILIAPELSFFPDIPQIPTPGVLFDPERHLEFSQKRESMNDLEITFWLQCAVRHWLGYRGIHFFNLYLHQRDYWGEVCIQSVEHPIFQEIIRDRETHNVLTCTPAAWAELSNIPLVKNRMLLVMESEVFAEKLLFSRAKTISLQPFLEQTETSFFIARFVREVVEKELSRSISDFPERVLMNSGARYGEFAQSLRSISPDLEEAAQWLENPETGLVRWTNYFPETGTLTFSAWHPKDWRELQQNFNNQKALLCLRHDGGESNAFCRVFMGRQDGTFLKKEALQLRGELIVPQNLVSSKSPDFSAFCADTITQLVEERDEKNWVAAGFSSLATLKTVGTLLQENPPKNCTVIGEKLTGGDTKMIGQLIQQKKAVLLLQKLESPIVEHLAFKTFVIQKFPFAPPHPLFGFFEKEFEKIHQKFWDLWTIPTVTARLSRMVGQFGSIETIIVLDPAESGSWGKPVLNDAFPYFHRKK
jgi:DNA polymerase III epsilon subunit-like protein